MFKRQMKNWALVALASGFLASCDKGPGGKQKNANGLEYEMVEDKEGTPAKKGDFITLHLSYFTDKDSLLNSTYKMGQPITSKVMDALFKGSFEEGLLMVSEGDSAHFWIPSDSLFKGQPAEGRPKFLPPGSKIKYAIRVVKVENPNNIESGQSKAIDEYGKNKNLKVEKTTSGLCYAIEALGTGPKATAGDTVVVHYVGTTLAEGKLFDSSRERNQPFSFPVGRGMVIPGWDEGLQLLPKGTKATLLIPSKLAYGEQGAPGSPIGPNAALVFEVEVLDVKPGKK
jgi:FKBP-type peptidyl-prolyl cis-trans isomerase FkpA